MRLLLTFFLLAFTLASSAAVYKWVDKDGKTHFSDKPIANSEEVEFKSNTQNQITPPPMQDVSKSTENSEELATSTQYSVRIQSPKEEETIRENSGDVTVMASISPDLKPNHLLVILMDDKVMGSAQTTPIFSLKNIPRGEHTFVIKAVAQNGKQLASSPPRKIYLHRTIVNNSKKPTPFGKGS
ncbi:DUF4124 domain-containing protein [Shewanella woodyi]|uniref:DUF4124 domain-containing protein n=1 Tax=Shewanella woodyi TaxID=60961 RepID=UPI003748935F